MRETLALVLAGGVGSRLSVLVRHRAKPAVPFGGIYRIIDFALSNAMNSGLTQVGVLTQYKPLSLMRHIGSGEAWDFVGRTREVKILPPRTGEKDSDWYKGTADAVRQNLDFIESRPSKEILILSGDHVYYMDYKALVQFHRETDAKVTVAMMEVPWEETHHFGIGITDEKGRVVDWEEKPEKARSNLASLGIYVFDTEWLVTALKSTDDVDFGHHILPKAMGDRCLWAFRFSGYWRDVGTVSAFWDANMDLLRPETGLHPEAWGIVTNLEADSPPHDRPPVRVLPGARVENSVLSPGCIVKGTVRDSVLSPGVVVEHGAFVEGSVLMHGCAVGRNARLYRVIADKETSFGDHSEVGLGDEKIPNKKSPKHLHTGLTLVGKGARIPEGAEIGTNTIVAPGVDEDYFRRSVPDLRVGEGETLEKEDL